MESSVVTERENKRSSPSMDTDRLSSLPDEVIYQILSFLPRTKHSVQTSVLSKRWRFLWTRVPFLGFDYEDTLRADTITKIVLQQHKLDIHTFSISIGPRNHEIEEEFQSWIVNITTRSTRELAIAIQSPPCINLNLPQCLFTCRTLVDLSLYGCGDIPVSGIYFPALKKLELDRVRFKSLESCESLAHLVSGCPVLEELSIQGIMLGALCCVSSPTLLKKLKLHYVRFKSQESLSGTISGCPVLEELIIKGVKLGAHCFVSSPTLTKLVLQLDDYDLSFGVTLDTPALRYLRLYSCMPDELSVGELDSLIEANIYSCNVLAFVGKLYNVKLLSLTIDGRSMINDTAFFASDIKFHNLTKLHLSAAHLGFIAFFLKNANNLQVLKFKIFNGKKCTDNEYGWKEPEQVPACLLSHLQTFELDLSCLRSIAHVFDMVRYILVNTKVLKRMKVVPNRWICKKKLEAFKRVVALSERGSQECELEYY